MKKISYVYPGAREEEIAHPPVAESLADEPDLHELLEVEEGSDMPELDIEEIEPLVVTFEEEEELPIEEADIIPFEEVTFEEGSEPSDEEVSEGLLHGLMGFEEGDHPEEQSDENRDGLYLPGSDVAYVEDPEPEPEEPKQTSWVDDRDVSHFTNYLQEGYPGGIPRHDGRSISGCERAYSYLNRLNNEVSEAVRKDVSHVLDMDFIEKARVNMIHDMSALKEHMGKLKKKLKSNSSVDLEEVIILAGVSDNELMQKEATVSRVQMVMTPFERAISGILVNSVVSGGHPFEDVYDFLKDKYKLTDREELAVLQLVMDYGFPIFKDRGTIGATPQSGKETEGHGIDFIKNYFG